MGDCHLGTSIPAWLKSQKKLKHLDFSYASISGTIPSWFWETISNLALLNVSFNQLHGQLPSPLNVALNAFIDLSSNLFEGLIPFLVGEIEFLNLFNDTLSSPIPGDIGASMAKLWFLSLSSNQITEDIPASIGNMPSIQVIDFSGNNLTGKLPSSIGNFSLLTVLDLKKNNLLGEIPASLGQLN